MIAYYDKDNNGRTTLFMEMNDQERESLYKFICLYKKAYANKVKKRVKQIADAEYNEGQVKYQVMIEELESDLDFINELAMELI